MEILIHMRNYFCTDTYEKHFSNQKACDCMILKEYQPKYSYGGLNERWWTSNLS